jgi:hypothetical protein
VCLLADDQASSDLGRGLASRDAPKDLSRSDSVNANRERRRSGGVIHPGRIPRDECANRQYRGYIRSPRACFPPPHRRHYSLFSEALRFALRYLFAIGSTSVNAAEACQPRCVLRLNPPALRSVVRVVGGRDQRTRALADRSLQAETVRNEVGYASPPLGACTKVSHLGFGLPASTLQTSRT